MKLFQDHSICKVYWEFDITNKIEFYPNLNLLQITPLFYTVPWQMIQSMLRTVFLGLNPAQNNMWLH